MQMRMLASRYRSGAILVALVAVSAPGCSSERGMGLRSHRAGENSSTIARDRSTIPQGQVIPPAGIGVDLVRANGGGLPRDSDSAVGLAGFAHNGVPGHNP